MKYLALIPLVLVASCPGGTVAHRDRQGMGIACVGVTAEPLG